MNPTDLAFLPAVDQAQLIRRSAISPAELTQIYLDRIDRLNPKLGSYFTVMAEQAMDDAIAKTEQLTRTDSTELPSLFGVTIAIKDLNAVKGVRYTCGSRAMAEHISDRDDSIVMKLRQAGCVVLGKTATSEMGSMPFSEPPGFLPARNPWHLDYTPGGSSGGAASAIAAGLSALAQGSDGGGSIRGPSSCCGTVGIKPSRGRVSFAPLGDCLSGVATLGPLGRTVTDAAMLLDAMSGYIIGDPYWLPDPPIPFRQVAQQAVHQPPSPDRIGVVTAIAPLGMVHPDCARAVHHIANAMAALGHHIEPVDLDCSALVDPFQVVWRAGVQSCGLPPEALEPINQWLVSRSDSSADYQKAVWAMQIASRHLVAQLHPYDAILMPIFMHPTIRVGEWADLPPDTLMQRVIHWVGPCPIANATGLPAIALPAIRDANHVPIGVQILGRPAAEAHLIQLAAQLEAAGAWDSDRPSLASHPK